MRIPVGRTEITNGSSFLETPFLSSLLRNIYSATLLVRRRENLLSIGTAAETGLDEEILMSRGEARDFSGKARETISANAVEALIGAIYLDQGYEAAKKFIAKNIIGPRLVEIKSDGGKDPKSLVQEYAQSEYKVTPTYQVLDESGPAHEREFKVGLYFNGDLKAEGEGKSKQEAETDAAQKFLEKKR